MSRARLMPTAVPGGSDRTVYLVVDDVGFAGGRCRETKAEIDLETLISDLIAGRFNDPVRILALDTVRCRSNDVSKEIADEIQARCDSEAMPAPEHIRDFVETYTSASAAAVAAAGHEFSAPRWREASTLW